LAIVLVPVAFFLEILPVIKLLLIVSLLLVMIVEVLNTALETVVNIVSPEFNHYAKMAKDLGSFAVLIALAVAALVWGYGFYLHFA
jgi:diacylglycerol kinase (ATP)